ncbi:MAG: hypothetical protein CSA95_03315 [Bacteroidetes bacterium]|nr:MAG: hypothetical protein CSA95_03315 [Bacteroidota bacterium]PIE88398.1 MAG: hypothetical protein CSA04_02100 [Bacteroidota bacterium]
MHLLKTDFTTYPRPILIVLITILSLTKGITTWGQDIEKNQTHTSSGDSSLVWQEGIRYLIKCQEHLMINSDSVTYFFDKAFKHATKYNHADLLAEYHNLRGFYHKQRSEFSKALIQYQEAYKISLAANNTIITGADLNYIANIYMVWGEYEKALKHYLSVLSLLDGTDEKSQHVITMTYNNLGIFYGTQNNDTLALNYYNKALKLSQELHDEKSVANISNNMGLIYSHEKEYAKAKEYYLKSLSYDLERGDKYGIAVSFGNIGRLHHLEKDFETANQYYQKAIKNYQEIKNKEGIADIKNFLGDVEKVQGNYQQAEKYYKESLALTQEIGSINLVMESLKRLHVLYYQKGEYQKAYQRQKEYHKLNDSVYNLEKKEKLIQIKTQNEFEKYSKNIELLEAKSNITHLKLEKQTLKNQQQRGILYTTVILMLIVVFILIYTIQNNKRFQRNNLKLKVKNREIEATKKELLLAKEKAEESDKLKSSFLANMSHEIRTPMNAILGFSELLTEEDITQKEKKEYINHIKSSGKILLTLINDIIDLARIEAGQIKIEFAPTPINKLFQELNEYYQERKKTLQKRHLQITYELGLTDEEALIMTDPERLRQIMTNLINNAIKFTEEGSIIFKYEKEGDHLLFSVTDTGIGIKEEDLHIIFDHFRQGDESYTRRFSGTGLGLTISKNLCELLGGEIWAKSKLHQGSQFFFRLPYKPIDSPSLYQEYKDPDTSVTAPNPSSQKNTILVVENEDTNFFLLENQLKNTGITLVRAQTGMEAIKIYQSNTQKIDLILMDIQMPTMNGYDTLNAIRKEDPNAIIIAQTAHAMTNEKQQILDRGFNDYIPKPVHKEKLTSILRKYL